MNSFGNSSYSLLVIHLHFLLLLLISITQFPIAGHGCPEHERKALLDIKSSLSDPSNRLSSWKEGSQHQNCCRWRGIGCSDDTFHVISIDLRNTVLEKYSKKGRLRLLNGDPFYVPPPETALHGKLSPSLSNITHLEYLDLSFNDFQKSQIPSQISHLTKLIHLDLSHSNFPATISTQFINLTSLQYLDLSCTDLYEIFALCLQLSSTKWVRGLENLKVLNLRGIDLSKATSLQKNFAEHISYLSNLEYLDISDCSISTTTSFPIHDFHNLSRLSTLKMSLNNELSSGIPVQMTNLTSLSILDLSYCGLQGSVPYLPQLKELNVSGNRDLRHDLSRMFQYQWPKLQTFYIDDANVSGSIPTSVSNAPLLVSFSAFGSSIQGSLPSSIGKLSRLQSLNLYGNKMTGYIPKSICKMSSLQRLILSSNNISGTIPSCLANLHNLTFFDVSGNSIGGTVSLINFINELNLTILSLESNRLTVDIDQRFDSYSKFKLEYLSLRSCNLKGLFPTFICKFTHLWSLDLSQNHLAGVIPFNCFSELQISGSFNLSNNKLHGPLPLPPEGVHYERQPYFDLSNNQLSGEISTESGKRLSSFSFINLVDNEISGSIPFSMFQNDSVVDVIDLSNNKLSGIIPTSIGYCKYLISLNLANNSLTGNVPNELEHINLNFLQLNDNNLDGTPLDFISKLQYLRVLNLANNHFGGSIPSKFGSLQDLQILSLRLNNFNGSIPEKIVQLKQLQILDLSENNLTGLIPRKTGNLAMLRSRTDNISSIVIHERFDVQLQMVIKGIMTQFEKLHIYSSGIDLSCNILEGNIPDDIGLLKGLSSLNLSHNRFSGVIPYSVGNMSGLESLDLSFNKLSGHIPLSLASMNYLEYLNLSYNNLSGRIPSEPHFNTLSGDGSAYLNNSLLCGFYTNNACDSDSPDGSYEDDKEDAKEKLLLYAIGAMGFGVGFWGLFLVLLLKKDKWWFPYWRLVDVVALRVANCLLTN